MEREKRLIKNSAILSLGSIVPRCLSLITLPVITACLTKTEYGTYDLISVLVMLFLPVVTLQLQAAAFRFLVGAREDVRQQKIIISNIFFYIILVCPAALFALYFFLWKLQVVIRLLIIVYFFADTILNTLRQIARGLGKNIMYSLSVLISSAVQLFLILFFLNNLAMGLKGLLVALAVSELLSAAFLFAAMRLPRYLSISCFSRKELMPLIAYAWPLIPNALSSWVVRASDRLILACFMGMEATAIYAVANKLPALFSVIQGTFSLAWQENASEAVQEEDSGIYYGKMFDAVFRLMVGMMALLIAFTPVIFKILIRGDYGQAYNHMSILYIGTLASMVSAYLGGIYIAHMKSREIGITTMIAAVINIVINVSFIKIIGIYAASLSTAVCYLWLMFYRMHDIQKIQKISFSYPKIIGSLLLLTGMAWICSRRLLLLDLGNIIIAVIIAVILNYRLLKKTAAMFAKKLIREKKE